MQTEFEATFWPINKDDARNKLKQIDGVLVHAERLMRRKAFNLPPSVSTSQRWARVRDEGDKITMSVKQISGENIEDQKEAQILVNDFDQAVEFLDLIGCTEKAFQETKRERWEVDGVEVTIDEWPFLEPLLEIEGGTENAVRLVSEKLNFSWSDARFCAVSSLYMEKFSITEDRINNGTPRLAFDDQNPFV